MIFRITGTILNTIIYNSVYQLNFNIYILKNGHKPDRFWTKLISPNRENFFLRVHKFTTFENLAR